MAPFATKARGNFPSKSGHEDMNTPHAWHKNHAHGAQQCLEPRHAAHTVQDGAQETACSGVRVALASTRQAAAHLFMKQMLNDFRKWVLNLFCKNGDFLSQNGVHTPSSSGAGPLLQRLGSCELRLASPQGPVGRQGPDGRQRWREGA